MCKCNALQPYSLPSAHVCKVRPEASTFFHFHRLSSSCSLFPPLLFSPLLVFLLAQLSPDHAHIFIATLSFMVGMLGIPMFFFLMRWLESFGESEWHDMTLSALAENSDFQWLQFFTTGPIFVISWASTNSQDRPLKALYTHEYQNSGRSNVKRLGGYLTLTVVAMTPHPLVFVCFSFFSLALSL